jgi:succinyl-CoA synthetase alpha subunit
MSILLDKNTKVLVQGITGKEGQKAAKAMLEYHTSVVCGVTPNKGGQEVEGKPVFNSIKEAKETCGDISVSAIYVPPFAAKAAILEAIDNDIPLISVIVERIPIKDTAYCLAAAKDKNIRIVGPSSLGFIVPGIGRVGVVGGPLVNEIFQPGSISFISWMRLGINSSEKYDTPVRFTLGLAQLCTTLPCTGSALNTYLET